MMEELAKAEKFEQLNRQKQRMKELKHKREVERLWTLKKERLMKEKDEYDRAERAIREKRSEEDMLIEEMKKNLVAEHMPFIQDFCSRELTHIIENQDSSTKAFGKETGLKFKTNNIFGLPQKEINQWEKENRNSN